jgi:uroporphyrinogen decarboxylase
MTSKERMLTAIQGGIPDRLPVTTHHVQPYFLNKYMDGKSDYDFFEHFGLDPIIWTVPLKPDESKAQYYAPDHDGTGSLQSRRIITDNWKIESQEMPDPKYKTVRYKIVTPKGVLTTVLQANDYTAWVSEHLIKEKSDIELIAEFATTPKCDIEAVNAQADALGQKGLVRGHICCFDIFGQPGCWQDACCLVGTEKLVMATFDDAKWVHQLLSILQKIKKGFIQSLQGARYDILELGGGDASTTVISPKIFNDFVAPYDSELIEAAHNAGQRIVYHTCGGMMPILDDIAAMKPDAMETFTPPEMGGDVDLAQAKKRIGDKVCMIGGFNQVHYLQDCSPEKTKEQVHQCFEQAGANGGYILTPSDHFMDAELSLIQAFADAARQCIY